MRIVPVSNNNNQTSFNAKFISNKYLTEAINHANDYDLMKFGKVLKDMSMANDGISYELYPSGSKFISVLLRKSKTCTDGSYHYSDTRLTSDKVPALAYKNVLKEATQILEKFYSKEEITDAPRAKLISIIEEFLNK